MMIFADILTFVNHNFNRAARFYIASAIKISKTEFLITSDAAKIC